MESNIQKAIDKVLCRVEHPGAYANIQADHLELLRSWNYYMKDKDPKITSDGTRKTYLQKVSFFLRHSQARAVDAIETECVERFFREHGAARGWEENTKNTYKRACKSFFKWYYMEVLDYRDDDLPRFIDREFTTTTPLDSVAPEDIPTEEEVKALMQAARNHRDRALIAVLANTGMRREEAVHLRKSHVIQDEFGVALQPQTAKKGRTDYRHIRLTWSRPAVIDWLNAHPMAAADAPLFCSLDKPYRRLQPGSVNNIFDRLLRYADLPAHRQDRLSPHKLRHYKVQQDKLDPHITEDMTITEVGWQSRVMMDRYGAIADSKVDEARIKEMVRNGQLPKDALDKLNDGTGDAKITLIVCPTCHRENSPEVQFCRFCSQPFTEQGVEEQDRLIRLLRQIITKDEVMETLKESLLKGESEGVR